MEKARTNTLTADDLTGANVTLTNPGGLGTVASVPRLMAGQGTIVATGSIAYPVGLGDIGAMIGAEKVMTMTSTYDHRIIQGAESGRFLGRIEEYLQGEHGFYEDVFAALGVELGPAPSPPAPAAAASAAASSAADKAPSAVPDEELLQAVQAASTLLSRFRSHGHLAARLDPLGSEPEGDPGLDPEALGLTPEITAKIPAKILHMYVPGATLADALPHLRETYCGTIAYEIEHIASHRQRVWLREQIESGAFRQPLTSDEQKTLLRRLTKVDALERFMHKAYLGQHQFSIEGLDMTVPMLDELIQLSAVHGGKEVVIGMAHRGRLNVLAHNLGRPYDTIFAEFEGASTLEAVTTIPQGGTGDVKYHHGTQGSYKLPDGESIQVNLESNPSHLEYVSPVVEGATRAAQTTRQGPHAHQDTDAAVPIVIHGDASFPAQGVVAETLNLQALDGYKVGGTVHLITNNQIGFTTDPDDARSTRWASDLAKGFDVPIIHVNADDVPACMSAVRLAFAFRKEFGHDVLIDLIGYRRFGHNESDEPAYTQPEMYAKIKTKKRVSELWAERLVADGVVSQRGGRPAGTGRVGQPDAPAPASEGEDRGGGRARHGGGRHRRVPARPLAEPRGEHRGARRAAARAGRGAAEGARRVHRAPEARQTARAPPRGAARRTDAVQTGGGAATNGTPAAEQSAPGSAGVSSPTASAPAPALDWAHGEALAFASLLTEGTPIRLTGQDTERGTFSQRHLVLHDAKTGQTVCPIQSLPEALAPLELHNSPLSELACMGFEYGYSQEAPETLVLWEAQFGDFVNSAQVIVDQFIASGLAKWGQTSRLTLLLPHGYEGSGPEHSSARLERFLALAAEGNIRVASPTTPAQYFHLLRRQARIAKQRPLVIMTPKSLLRLPQATSTIADLAENTQLPAGARRARASRTSRSRAWCCAPGRSTTTSSATPSASAPRPGGRARGAAVPLPRGPDPGADEPLPEPARGGVGAGGAAQHGRARAHVPAADADHARRDPLRLHRPSRARQPGRGLSGRAHRRTEPHRQRPRSTWASRSRSTRARRRESADVLVAETPGADHAAAQTQAPRLLNLDGRRPSEARTQERGVLRTPADRRSRRSSIGRTKPRAGIRSSATLPDRVALLLERVGALFGVLGGEHRARRSRPGAPTSPRSTSRTAPGGSAWRRSARAERSWRRGSASSSATSTARPARQGG